MAVEVVITIEVVVLVVVEVTQWWIVSMEAEGMEVEMVGVEGDKEEGDGGGHDDGGGGASSGGGK